MLQTRKKIIPIFYHVQPSHLRWVAHGRGVYSEAFAKHENDGRYTPQRLEEWKMALSKASAISGFEVNERQKDEGLLLKNIVNTVNNVMKEMKDMPLLHVATHPVGLDEAIEEFQNYVETQCVETRQNVKIVGIAGLGGCGKTTLVKEYFNQKRSFYTQSSFLCGVRDAAARNNLHNLQNQLVEDLVNIKEDIHNTSEGKRTLEKRVRSVKALIVLDDVDHIDQIEALLPLKGNLQPDSLIVVTTCDSSVIASSASLSPSVSVFVYRKRCLDSVHAKQLFCWHSFLKDSPANGFEDLVEDFLYACQGLPLSLKVLGAQLYGKNSRDYWMSVLRKISKILPDDVKDRLKVSYDALDEEQQQIFLDIACFFIGEQKDTAISIWDGSGWDGFLWSGWHGFQILESKCLVEVDHENCIRMHDHLRDLGREIAIKKTPSRFWSLSQFVNSQRPLKERLPIRGIMAAKGWESNNGPLFEKCMQLLMGHSTRRSRRLTPSALGVQLLVVRGKYFKEQFAQLSEELVWLRWYDFPHGKLPSWLSTKKLRVLELNRAERLAELWGPNDAHPSQLRELIINRCNLQMIPETIGFLKHLKKIVLECTRWAKIEISSLPEQFCLLESLEHLELPDFSNLSSLPTDFGNLRKLKYINLSRCKTLTALPVSFNQLTELQYLDLSWCENLQFEKDILENIKMLETLRLGGCSKLQQLPRKITRQMYLRELCLSPTGLRELPADIDRLAKLEVLEIGSPCLTSLPTSLGNLSSLIKLEIKNCRELKHFPCLGNLSWLTKLRIEGCGELTHLPPVGCLTRLENLDLISSGVEYLPEGFGQLVNLQGLVIRYCPIRESLNHVDSSMFKFLSLKSMHLSNTEVPTISISEDCCPSLEHLNLSQNYDLMEIETLPITLKRVDIEDCEKLKNIRGVAGLAELQHLNISDCAGLEELPSFAGLVELQRLCIQLCPELSGLPSFACCTCLEDLSIRDNSTVTKIEGLEELRSLRVLCLRTCWKGPGITSLKNQDKLILLQIRAESRSAIETCIPPNILKRPCTMDIMGRAVEDVESVVGSLRFPNLHVVDELRSAGYGGCYRAREWEMKAPVSSASCVIACFVISCLSGGWGFVRCHYRGEEITRDVMFYPPLEEKQVYISVCTEGFHLDFKEGSEDSRLFMTLEGHIEVEEGMAVIMRKGEEGKASEALHKFMELLA